MEKIGPLSHCYNLQRKIMSHLTPNLQTKIRTFPQFMDRSEQSALVQVEEGHNLAHIFGLLTGFHKQLTVMECKANDLLYM